MSSDLSAEILLPSSHLASLIIWLCLTPRDPCNYIGPNLDGLILKIINLITLANSFLAHKVIFMSRTWTSAGVPVIRFTIDLIQNTIYNVQAEGKPIHSVVVKAAESQHG